MSAALLAAGAVLMPVAGAGVASAATTSAAASAAASAAGTSAATTPGGLTSGITPLAPTTSSAPALTSTQPVITNATAGSGSGGLSGPAAVAIAAGAVIVLGGISLFIWRDARRRAPVRAGADGMPTDGGRRTGSKPPPRSRKLSPAERRRRKRGKAR